MKKLLVLSLILFTGCTKAKELFTSPPHGANWEAYHAEQDCEKNCDKEMDAKRITSCECAD